MPSTSIGHSKHHSNLSKKCECFWLGWSLVPSNSWWWQSQEGPGNHRNGRGTLLEGRNAHRSQGSAGYEGCGRGEGRWGQGWPPAPRNRHLDRACLMLGLSGLRENLKKKSRSAPHTIIKIPPKGRQEMLMRSPPRRTRWMYKHVQAVKEEVTRKAAEGMGPRNTSEHMAPPASIQEAPWPELETIIFWQACCPLTRQH